MTERSVTVRLWERVAAHADRAHADEPYTSSAKSDILIHGVTEALYAVGKEETAIVKESP